MKISDVLKRAKAHMRTNRFVCNAINDCDIFVEDKIKTQEYIRDLLEHRLSVEVWLQERAMIKAEDMNLINMRDYRLRWIDHMIAQLEKEGK